MLTAYDAVTGDVVDEAGVDVILAVAEMPFPSYGHDGTESIDNAGRLLEDAGACALVLEHVPANVDREVTDAVSMPTTGIGAGPDCEVQAPVDDDAITDYRETVESDEFTAAEHSHAEDDLGDIH